jgi:hypothetical protein
MKTKLRSAIEGNKVGLFFAAALGFSGVSHGSSQGVAVERFELKVVENTVGANEIIAGEFADALQQLRYKVSYDSEFFKRTNLCAAYVATGELVVAKPHCRAALRTSRHEGLNYRPSKTTRVRQAVALNNLGVLYALAGEHQESQQFFESAGGKSSEMKVTSARNINILEQRAGDDVASSY